MKKKLDIKKIQNRISIGAEQTSWEKAYFWSFIITVVVFIASCLIIAVKPVPKEIKNSIDSEVKETNVYFDKQTLTKIKERQELPPVIKPVVGKDPFSL